MRRANRIDANHVRIVEALRRAGAYVRTISQGEGLPDLLVGYMNPVSQNRYCWLVEVKDGSKPPSARTLTELEQKFFNEWPGGNAKVITSEDEALRLIMAAV